MDENKVSSAPSVEKRKEVQATSMRLSQATKALFDEAARMCGGTQDEALMSIVSAYIQQRKGKMLSSENSDYKDCLKQFEENQMFQLRLMCTAIEQAKAEKAGLVDQYERIVSTVRAKNEDLVVSEKEAKAAAEAARKEAEAARKELESAQQRSRDLEEKMSMMAKASELADKRIADLSVQLSSNAEKIARYESLTEENRHKDAKIRDLEEQIRMLQKDLEYIQETAQQRIKIVELEAANKLAEAAAGRMDSSDLPFN